MKPVDDEAPVGAHKVVFAKDQPEYNDLPAVDLKLERLTMSLADAEFIAQNEYVFKVLLMWPLHIGVYGLEEE